MLTELLLYLGFIFVGVAIFHFVYKLFSNANPSTALSWATGDTPTKSNNKLIEFSRPLVHQFTLRHAVKIKNANYRTKIENLLITSGLEAELNVDEFIGFQILWGVITPVSLGLLNILLQLGYSTWVILMLCPLGLFLPSIYAGSEKRRRYTSVIIDLPFYIDLLALSTEAGLDFIGGLQKIVEKSEKSVLAGEFEKVLRDIKLGSTREKALRDMALRLDTNEVSSFVNVVTDADATGASIGLVLKEQSNQMRMERFVRAEKAGARASQAILLPLMFFILPAVFIMLFAPIALQFFYGK